METEVITQESVARWAIAKQENFRAAYVLPAIVAGLATVASVISSW